MKLDYFRRDDSFTGPFCKLPKALLYDTQLQAISPEAKLLYTLLLDRVPLSQANGWVDEQNRPYIFFTIDEVMSRLSCASQKACKTMSALEKAGLIRREYEQKGKPVRIFVQKIVMHQMDGTDENQNHGLLNFETRGFPKSKSMNTEDINTDSIENKSLPLKITSGRKADNQEQMELLLKGNWNYSALEARNPDKKYLLQDLFEAAMSVACGERGDCLLPNGTYSGNCVSRALLNMQSHMVEQVLRETEDRVYEKADLVEKLFQAAQML